MTKSREFIVFVQICIFGLPPDTLSFGQSLLFSERNIDKRSLKSVFSNRENNENHNKPLNELMNEQPKKLKSSESVRPNRPELRGDNTRLFNQDYVYTPSMVTVNQEDIIKRINKDKIIGVDNYNQFNQVNSEAQDFSRSLKYVMTDYDKRIRPLASAENTTDAKNKNKPRGPLEIESTIVVTAFGPVSDQHGEFTCSMFLRQAWIELRFSLLCICERREPGITRDAPCPNNTTWIEPLQVLQCLFLK